MNAVFKTHESFRDDFTFSNSPQAIRRFPLPFPDDHYMYSVNIEPHLPGSGGSVTEHAFDVDEHYVAECRERAIVLAAEPLRFQALPHMMSAQWDCLELIMESLSKDYPAYFSLSRRGNRWHWINRPLEIEQRFTFGDAATLPRQPLDYVTRQAQGDFVVMDQRDGDLWIEAGMVTTAADWSLDFDMGMTFKEWRPRAEVLAESSPRKARAAAELDHDCQPAPRYFARELSGMGKGPCLGDGAERRRPRAPARRTAGPVAAAAQQRHRLRHPLLPDEHARIGHGAEMGAPRPPGIEESASGPGRLQGIGALSGRAGGMVGAFR
jgi:hypothetical protein